MQSFIPFCTLPSDRARGPLRHFGRLVVTFVVIPSGVAARAAPLDGEFRELCPGVQIEKGFELDLTAVETRLVCGDPKPDEIGVPWSRIPPNQAQWFLKTFLQTRARHNPVFAVENGVLFVKPGDTTPVTDFEIHGSPSDWKPPRLRDVKGRALSPSVLDELNSWTSSQLANAGYACNTVEIAADPETGLVRAWAEPGRVKPILDVVDESRTDLAPGVLDRYNAFLIGQPYNEYLIKLTRKRILDAGLLQAVSITHDCYPNGVIIKRDAVLGPPREARFGIGGDSDQGPRVRALLRQLRLGDSASNIELRIDGSIRRQRSSLLGRWYYSSWDRRDFLEPTVTFERLDEPKIRSRALQASVFHGWERELSTGRATLRAGPSWQIFTTSQGAARAEARFVSLEGRASWLSHESEIFQTSPRGGSRMTAEFSRTQRDWGSDFTATRFSTDGLFLQNLYNYDPPLLVLGLRYQLGTTLAEGLRAEQLPVRYQFFAGGPDDLRGFYRQSLPFGGGGALTEAIVGLEARRYKALFKRVDPFGFVDIGKLGRRSFRFDGTTFVSPGLGLRWESPVGTFRGFVAQGLTYNEEPGTPKISRWRAGFQFGEEF